MSKLRIQGHFIGADADEVGYGKNNAETVEDALDALFEGAGGGSSSGDEISNADLALLADELLVAGGMTAGKIVSGDYAYLVNKKNSTAVGSVFNQEIRGYSWFGAKMRVYKGDTLHYAGLGYGSNDQNGYIPFVLTDIDNVVVYIPTYGLSTGTYVVTVDGWCYALATSANAALWTTWTERRTLRNKKKIYMAYGDSISSDNTVTPDDGSGFFYNSSTGKWGTLSRPICYPRIVATLLNAEVHRFGKAGDNFAMTLNGINDCPIDADIVSVMIGANDKTQITRRDGSGMTLPSSGSLPTTSTPSTYTYTVQSDYLATLLNTSGLLLAGDNVRITGITVNGVTKYSDNDGIYLFTNYNSFCTAAGRGVVGSYPAIPAIDIGTIAKDDVITATVIATASSNISFRLATTYDVGVVSEVMAVQDIDSSVGVLEIKSTYLGRYRYFIEKVLARTKKDTVKMFCISNLNDLNLPSNNTGAKIETMRRGLKSLIAAMNDSRLVYVRGTDLIENKASSDLWLDDLHPNENGQVVIGNTLATIIKENLS